MLNFASIILITAGVLLMIAAAVIFFVSDCFSVFKNLRTTKKLVSDVDLSNKTAGNIYYEKQAESVFKKPDFEKPRFKRDDGFDAKTDTAFLRTSYSEARVSEQTADDEPIWKSDGSLDTMSLSEYENRDAACMTGYSKKKDRNNQNVDTVPLRWDFK